MNYEFAGTKPGKQPSIASPRRKPTRDNATAKSGILQNTPEDTRGLHEAGHPETPTGGTDRSGGPTGRLGPGFPRPSFWNLPPPTSRMHLDRTLSRFDPRATVHRPGLYKQPQTPTPEHQGLIRHQFIRASGIHQRGRSIGSPRTTST